MVLVACASYFSTVSHCLIPLNNSDGYSYDAREIDENALEQALSGAITCTILAGAGPQRSRVLATLYKVLIFSVHLDVFGLNTGSVYSHNCGLQLE
jgi:hypothetical protein